MWATFLCHMERGHARSDLRPRTRGQNVNAIGDQADSQPVFGCLNWLCGHLKLLSTLLCSSPYALMHQKLNFMHDLKMTPYGPTHETRNGTEHQTCFLLCREGLGTRLTCTGPGYQIMRIIGASLSEPHIDDYAVNFPYILCIVRRAINHFWVVFCSCVMRYFQTDFTSCSCVDITSRRLSDWDDASYEQSTSTRPCNDGDYSGAVSG